MKYLHTMVRVSDLEASLDFYIKTLGLVEHSRQEVESGRFTLVFLHAPGDQAAMIELTYNWDESGYSSGRNFGHIAYQVDNIYIFCQQLLDQGVIINRPPRDGHMAFIKSPDGISIELIQKGESLPLQEPWLSMTNEGTW